MHHCPHCGADLRDNARFCPRCMTTLNEKRVVPTPTYLPTRWLSATVAVLVLLVAVWSVGQLRPQEVQDAVTPAVSTTTKKTSPATIADTTTATEVQTTTDGVTQESTTLTTLAEAFGSNPTDPTTTQNTWRPTYDTTGRVPPFLTTTTGRFTTTLKTTTTKTTTTTKKTTTAPTTTTTTRPYWIDGNSVAVTEDGLPIEEVTWTYEPITSSSISLPKYAHKYDHIFESSSTYTTTPSGIPLNQCIKVTGFTSPTSNGIYRVPAVIDGKVVAIVDLKNAFTDEAVALATKRIYFPPDMLSFHGGTEKCTNLEGMYFTGPEAWFASTCIPEHATSWWGGVETYYLTLYVVGGFDPLYIYRLTPPVFLYACRGNNYKAESGIISAEACRNLYGGGDI